MFNIPNNYSIIVGKIVNRYDILGYIAVSLFNNELMELDQQYIFNILLSDPDSIYNAKIENNKIVGKYESFDRYPCYDEWSRGISSSSCKLITVLGVTLDKQYIIFNSAYAERYVEKVSKEKLAYLESLHGLTNALVRHTNGNIVIAPISGKFINLSENTRILKAMTLGLSLEDYLAHEASKALNNNESVYNICMQLVRLHREVHFIMNKAFKLSNIPLIMQGLDFNDTKRIIIRCDIYYEDFMYREELVIPDGIHIVGRIFNFSTRPSDVAILKRIILGKDVKRIESGVFKGMDTLQEVVFNKGLEVIERQAFEGCKGLRELKFPNTVKRIEHSAFLYCTSLERVEFSYPNTVAIGEGAFLDCINLTEIRAAGNVMMHGSSILGCEKLERIAVRKKLRIKDIENCKQRHIIDKYRKHSI